MEQARLRRARAKPDSDGVKQRRREQGKKPQHFVLRFRDHARNQNMQRQIDERDENQKPEQHQELQDQESHQYANDERAALGCALVDSGNHQCAPVGKSRPSGSPMVA